MYTVDDELAQKLVARGIEKAAQMGVPVSVSVLDAGRDLVAFRRMDNSRLGTIEISQAKAYTARTFNMRTDVLTSYVQPGAAFFGLETTHQRPLCMLGGGIPLEHNGKVIGAIGVSGGSIEEDVAIAEHCVAGF